MRPCWLSGPTVICTSAHGTMPPLLSGNRWKSTPMPMCSCRMRKVLAWLVKAISWSSPIKFQGNGRTAPEAFTRWMADSRGALLWPWLAEQTWITSCHVSPSTTTEIPLQASKSATIRPAFSKASFVRRMVAAVGCPQSTPVPMRREKRYANVALHSLFGPLVAITIWCAITTKTSVTSG